MFLLVTSFTQQAALQKVWLIEQARLIEPYTVVRFGHMYERTIHGVEGLGPRLATTGPHQISASAPSATIALTGGQ